MSARATKLFPVLRHWTHDAPHAVHIVDTKAEADDLIEGGAFTDDPNHPDRDHDAPDLTVEPDPAPEPQPEPAPEPEPA